MSAIATCHRDIVACDDDVLSAAERCELARVAAHATDAPELHHWLSEQAPAADLRRVSGDRAWRSLVTYAERLAAQPPAADDDDIALLFDAGVSAHQLVVASQVVGLVCYEARLLSALLALPAHDREPA